MKSCKRAARLRAARRSKSSNLGDSLRQGSRPLRSVALTVCWVLAVTSIAVAADVASIEVETLDRTTPVDFATEILPIFRASCLACHNDRDASGELSLESPAAILRGGSQGPAVLAHRGAESLLVMAAAHRGPTIMPPPENDVDAAPLTSHQLGLIQLWIDQGATGSVLPPRPVRFQPLAADFQPIFATAVTRDGQYAACARGNRIDVYHLPTKRLITSLADPNLQHESAAAERLAHRDIIRALAFDPSGRWLASGGFRTVKLWRRPHLNELHSQDLDAAVTAVALSRDATRFAVGDAAGRVSVRDLESGSPSQVRTLHGGAVAGLALSPDGTTLVSCSDDSTLCWSSITGGQVLQKVTTPAPIHAVVILHQGQRMATAHQDGIIRIWSFAGNDQTGSALPLRDLQGHQGGVTALAAVPGTGDQCFSAGDDGTIRRWNITTGEQLDQWDHGAPVAALALRADGARLASMDGSTVKLWNVADGSLIAELKQDPRDTARAARIEAEIGLLQSAIDLASRDIKSYSGAERRVKTTAEALQKAEDESAKAATAIEEKRAALQTATAESKEAGEIEKLTKQLTDAEIARDVALTIVRRAKRVAEKAVQDLADAVQEIADRESLLQQQQAELAEAQEIAKAGRPVRAVAFTAADRLVSGVGDGALHVYDAQTGSPLKTVTPANSAIAAIAATPTGEMVVGTDGGMVHIDRFDGDWTLQRIIGDRADPATLLDRVLALAFSPDGSRLAVGGGLPGRCGELKSFDSASGRLLHEDTSSHSDTILAIDFSADGTQLATASADRLVKIFRVNDGQCLQSMAGHTAHVTGVSFRGDGERIVSSGGDRLLKVWDVDTGRPIVTMKGTTYKIGAYRREVAAASFIGASEQILAGSGDGTVRLHRDTSKDDILTFAGSSGYIYSVAASSDARALVAGGSEGVLYLWSGQDRSPQASFPPP